MSTQPRLQPTRRTVLRTVAWTAPAVSIAVAAPAFATSHDHPISGSATTIKIERVQGNNPKVIWTITLKNTSGASLINPQVVFDGVTSTTGLVVTSTTGVTTTPSTTWTGSGLTTRTYPGTILDGGSVTVVATFSRSDSATGTAAAAFTSPGFTGNIPAGAAYKN